MKGLIFITPKIFSNLEDLYTELSLIINNKLYLENIITYQTFKQVEEKLLNS